METKYCNRCEKDVPTSDFTKSKNRYDGLQVYCSECMRLYRREHYSNNKQQYKDRNLKTSLRLRQIVVDLKNSGSCKDCGIKYPNEPWLFEFDHRSSKTKINCIGRICDDGSETKLLSELKKCDLVCLICHRRRTAKKFHWKENRYAGKVL